MEEVESRLREDQLDDLEAIFDEVVVVVVCPQSGVQDIVELAVHFSKMRDGGVIFLGVDSREQRRDAADVQPDHGALQSHKALA